MENKKSILRRQLQKKIKKIVFFSTSCLTLLERIDIVITSYGGLAQLVEHLVYTQVVGGSIPSSSTFLRDVAQLVAHLVWDQRVAGSNPVVPTQTSKA